MRFKSGDKVCFLPGVESYGVTRTPYGNKFVKSISINEGDTGTFVEDYVVPESAFSDASIWALVKVEREGHEYYCPTPLRSIEIIEYKNRP